MNLAQKFAKESIISLLGVVFGNINRYLFTVIIARWTGIQVLGLYSLANSIIMIVESVAKLGLERGVLRYVSMLDLATEKSKIREITASALKMTGIASLLLSLLLILFSGWLVFSLLNEEEALHSILLMFALILPLNALTNVGVFATQGLKLLKYKVVVTQIINPMVLVIGGALLLFFWSDIKVVIIPVTIAAITSIIVLAFFLKKLLDFKAWNVITASWDKSLLAYSVPLMFIGILQTVMHWMDILMLGYFTDAAQVGLYHPAVRTAGLMQAVILSMMSIYAPLAAQLFGKNDMEGLSNLFKLTARWSITLTLPIAVIFLVIPNKIMLVFGAEYVSSSMVLMILAGATFIQVIGSAATPIITITGHTKLSLLNSIIALVMNVVLNIFLIPLYGIIGAGLATFISITLIGLLRNIEVYYLFKMNLFSKPLYKPFLAGLILFLILNLMKPLIMPFHTIITGSIVVISGFTIYGLILYALKLEPEDADYVSGIIILKDLVKK